MSKICYVPKNFRYEASLIIHQANEIIQEYLAEGYKLTLRQLYYQFVSRDLIQNNQKSYNKLGIIINDARLAGLVDWQAIEDRTRNLESNTHWNSPAEIIRAAANEYQIDKWADQSFRIEVWIEKDALTGVIEGVCNDLDIPYFSCRGYTSQSEMWKASLRFEEYIAHGQTPIIFHLGDHDPSGVDMTRDIQDRQNIFSFGEEQVIVERLALNIDQVKKYNPPPNFAKISDSRSTDYIRKYGRSSWELDALEPRVIRKLIEDEVLNYRNDKVWNDSLNKELNHIDKLMQLAEENSD